MSDKKGAPPSGPDAQPLVVGIGASAGGLAAYSVFFRKLPPDSGMAFVLVQHLSPDHPSSLAELIGEVTTMPVVDAHDGQEMQADHVYVIPPDSTMTVEGNRLRVVKPRTDNAPVDAFLTSLAQEHADRAVAVILTGFGADGALGLAAVKEHGGVTFAQSDSDPKKPLAGMPFSAFETGLVDHVLPVEEIPARLLEYQRHMADVRPSSDRDAARTDVGEHLPEICRIIDLVIGHDFSRYKEASLVRRVQRRMQLHGLRDTKAYVAMLSEDGDEVGLLFKDLLIGVTRFFRDPSAFAALDRIVLSELVKQREIRIWVPGCASGEEAYSIAILLREAIAGRRDAPRVCIFATDISESAIQVARKGVYLRSQLEGLTAGQVKRWFVEDRGFYTVVQELRETCVFSLHSVTRDPPFSRLDLVSCRNLLIYMTAELQGRIIQLFHYALRAGGFLFLGPSEAIAREEDYFVALDSNHHIFRRRDGRVSVLPDFPGARAQTEVTASTAALPSGVAAERDLDRAAQRAVARYAPAYVVVDKRHRIVRFSGHTGKFLEPTEGPATFGLFELIHHSLRSETRDAINEATETQARVMRSTLLFEADGMADPVQLIVEPIEQASGEAKYYVVAFQEASAVAGIVGAPADDEPGSTAERDLRSTRARLRAVADERKRSEEGLLATNQELQSVNEELQAAIEELQVSKEEMQSLNEELHTVNTELISKNAAAASLNADLRNFLENTGGATLFLDSQMAVRRFTPSATAIFHLRATDVGRPITEVGCRIDVAGVVADVRTALDDQSGIEREVADEDNVYLMRIRPYRTLTDEVDGAVLSFTDITERKAREAAQAELAAIVASTGDAVLALDANGTVTSWNAGAEHLIDFPESEVIDAPFSSLLPPEGVEEAGEIFRTAMSGKHVEQREMRFRRKDGSYVEVVITASPMTGPGGSISGVSVIARDNSERIELEQHRAIMMAELDHRVKNTLATVQAIARQTAKGSDSVDGFLDAFDQRIIAFARTHDLLTADGGAGAMLQELVEGELKPYASRDISIAGEPVRLDAKAALALGLAIHELATNASKHGSLSVPEGRVAVSWKVADANGARRLAFEWTESGGPTVHVPEHRGFGSRLIERGLVTEMEADIALEFLPAGVHFTLSATLDEAE